MGQGRRERFRFRAFQRLARWVTRQVESDPDYWREIQRTATDETTYLWASYGAARVATGEDLRRFIAATQPEGWEARRAETSRSESVHPARPEGFPEGSSGQGAEENLNARGTGSQGLSQLTGPLTMEKLERRGDELGI